MYTQPPQSYPFVPMQPQQTSASSGRGAARLVNLRAPSADSESRKSGSLGPSDSKSELPLDPERLALEAEERRAILSRRTMRASIILDKENSKKLDAMYESRSFKIISGILLALMCIAMVFCVRTAYYDDMPTKASKFRDTITGTTSATVVQQGYSYTGDCPMHKRPDAPGVAVNCQLSASDMRKCVYEYYQELPVDRRLQADSNASEARSLLGVDPDKCVNEWVPWYKVQFSIMGGSYERCSYRMGSKLNSQTTDWWRVHKWSHENPKTLPVWKTTTPDHCIVGFATLDELDQFYADQRNPNSGLLATMYLFSGFAAFSTCFSLRYSLQKIDPDTVTEDAD